MSRKRRNEVFAGLFIIASTFLFFLLLFMMGTFQNVLRQYRNVEVVFEDVQGLRRGDPVYFLGRKIGSVARVEFHERVEPHPVESGKILRMSRVLVTLSIPEAYWRLLKTDSTVVVDKSITGNLSVLIREGESNNFLANQEDDVRISGAVYFSMDDTAQKLTTALEKANRILSEFAAILDNLRESGHLQSILQDLADTTTRLKNNTGPIADRVASITEDLQKILHENRPHLKVALENIAKSSDLLKSFLDERLVPAADSLESALASARNVAKSFDGLLARNRSRLDEIVESLSNSATSAETLIGEVRRRPWRLLYEPTPAEVETLGIYDAAWAYNLAASELNRSVNELAALARDAGDLDRAVIERALDQVEATLRDQQSKEEAFYELLRSRVVGK